MIPLAKPFIGLREKFEVLRVLNSRNLAQGKQVQKFESEFSTPLAPAINAIAVNSGTSALHLSLLAAGIGPGDEVLVPSFTFAATANAVLLTGATPVFVDISPDSFTMDSTKLGPNINSNSKAIIPVHLYGHPANMLEIQAIGKVHGLLIVEDAAQAHFAEIGGERVGTFGDLAAFSFYPTKNMTSGEGGMVVTTSSEYARKIQLLRNQGMEKRYHNEIVGFNNRMTDIHAAIGRIQLTRLSKWTAKRIANAQYLSENLRGIPTPSVSPGFKHVFHQYTIRVQENRDQFARVLRDEHGIESGVYYPVPVHRLPSMEGRFPEADLPETELASSEVLSIPVHPFLSSRELDRVIRAVNSVAKAGG